jgi:3-oxoacyl-[acyl-carrier-protein] synthase-3
VAARLVREDLTRKIKDDLDNIAGASDAGRCQMRRSVIIGTGSALPVTRVTNAQLAERGIDTTHEWIVERTGITAAPLCRRRRDHGQPRHRSRAQGAGRGRRASGQDRPDRARDRDPRPDLSGQRTRVQTALGINDCIAFDVAAVCTAFFTPSPLPTIW